METPLSCMYLMPNTQQASTNATDQTMTEIWKGPWSEIRKVADVKNNSVFGVKLVVGMKRPDQLNGQDSNWKCEFQAPLVSTVDSDVVWTIQSVKATEIIAGELGQIEIQYQGVRTDGQGEDAFEQTQPTTWSLHWGSEQRSPLAYCQDTTGGRAEEVMACLKNPHPTVQELRANGYPSATDEDAKYNWWSGTDDIYRSIGVLTSADKNGGREIYDYMSREIAPIFHYPIIERNMFVREAPAVVSADYRKMKPQKIADIDKVDYKTNFPTDCPFTGLSGWEWLCVEDNYEGYFKGTYGYNRTTVWWGAKKVDDNFYGPDGTRWELPTANVPPQPNP